METGVGAITIAGIANYSGDGQTFSLTFADTGNAAAENELPNGAYTLTVHASGVTYADGSSLSANQVFGFYRDYGDFLGNGDVNGLDFSIFAHYFGSADTTQSWYIDSNDDGYINGSDFLALASAFGVAAPGSNSGDVLTGAPVSAVYGPEGIVLGVEALVPLEQAFYYTNQWQQIQTTQAAGAGTPTIASQNVWGISYVNDLVLRDDNSIPGSLGKAGSGLGQRLYALHDANHDVTSITDDSGNVLEQFTYDAYGNVTVLTTGDAVGIDQYNWSILYQGGKRDATTGFYEFQRRDYDPSQERWMEEDPGGYVNSYNLSQFELSSPIGLTDFNGEGIHHAGDQYCQALLQSIYNKENDIAEREKEYSKDPLQLPERAPGDTRRPSLSRWGHRIILAQMYRDLNADISRYKNECQEDPPPNNDNKPEPIIPEDSPTFFMFPIIPEFFFPDWALPGCHARNSGTMT